MFEFIQSVWPILMGCLVGIAIGIAIQYRHIKRLIARIDELVFRLNDPYDEGGCIVDPIVEKRTNRRLGEIAEGRL